MTDAPVAERQGFHLVDPSPWPIIGAAFAFLTAAGLIMTMHQVTFVGVKPGAPVLALGGAGVLFTMAGWWRGAGDQCGSPLREARGHPHQP